MIPWTAAHTYAVQAGMSADDFALMWTCFRRMEQVQNDFEQNERKRKSKQDAPQKRKARSRNHR